MSDIKVVVNGVWAAGVVCTKIIMAAVKNIVGCDDGRAVSRPSREHELDERLVRAEHEPE